MLKSIIIITISLLILTSCSDSDPSEYPSEFPSCTGEYDCEVCTDCSRCAYCSDGGSCGVCEWYSRVLL